MTVTPINIAASIFLVFYYFVSMSQVITMSNAVQAAIEKIWMCLTFSADSRYHTVASY